MKVFKGELMFDTPVGPKESNWGDYQYYSIGIKLGDPSAPKANEDGVIYLNFNEGSDTQEYIRGLSAGDEIQVVYDDRGKHPTYKAVIEEGRKPKVTPTEVSADGQPRRSKSAGLLNEYGINAWLAASEQCILILSKLHSAVSSDPVLGQLGEEAQQKYAVTAFIHGDRNRHGVVLDEGEEEEGEDAAEIVMSADVSKLPMSLIVAISEASSHVDEPKQVAETLKRFGFSRDDIDPNDKESWLELYAIVDTFHEILSERDEASAVRAVTSLLGRNPDEQQEQEELF